MGQSLHIFEKKPIILTLEVDNEFYLEMGTGFGPAGRGQALCIIPVTIEELELIQEKLKELVILAKSLWKCESCGEYNHPEEVDNCTTCEAKATR